jgi:hypothetical protein
LSKELSFNDSNFSICSSLCYLMHFATLAKHEPVSVELVFLKNLMKITTQNKLSFNPKTTI